METAREKYFIANSMICLLKAVEGKSTTVELRDDRELIGDIVSVDGYMNITMKDVTFVSRKGEQYFDHFFVNGKTVRYVHIPDELNMRRSMENVLKRYNMREANIRVRKEIHEKALEKMQRKHAAARKAFERSQRK